MIQWWKAAVAWRLCRLSTTNLFAFFSAPRSQVCTASASCTIFHLLHVSIYSSSNKYNILSHFKRCSFYHVRNVSMSWTTTNSAAAEIARVGGHYAVQGHSRSLISVYQLKAGMRPAVTEGYWLESYLASFSNYREILVKLSHLTGWEISTGMGDCVIWIQFPVWDIYVTSHPGQLSLAILSWYRHSKYQLKGGDVLRLGSKGRCGSCVGGR